LTTAPTLAYAAVHNLSALPHTVAVFVSLLSHLIAASGHPPTSDVVDPPWLPVDGYAETVAIIKEHDPKCHVQTLPPENW